MNQPLSFLPQVRCFLAQRTNNVPVEVKAKAHAQTTQGRHAATKANDNMHHCPLWEALNKPENSKSYKLMEPNVS